MSSRLFRILVACAGIAGVGMLNIFYAELLFPPGALHAITADNIQQLANQFSDVVFLDVWLQGTGTLLTTLFFLALITLSSATNRFAGWIALIALTLILVIGHIEDLFTLTSVLAAQRGHIDTAMVTIDLSIGNRAVGTLFYMAAVPALYISLGSILRSSNVLPQVFSYMAFALGIGFEIVGFAGLFSISMRPAFSASFILRHAQDLWVVAAAVMLITRARSETGRLELATQK